MKGLGLVALGDPLIKNLTVVGTERLVGDEDSFFKKGKRDPDSRE